MSNDLSFILLSYIRSSAELARAHAEAVSRHAASINSMPDFDTEAAASLEAAEQSIDQALRLVRESGARMAKLPKTNSRTTSEEICNVV